MAVPEDIASPPAPEFEYRVRLEVKLVGPERDWEYVAAAFAGKVGRLSPLDGSWKVVAVEVDTAAEVAEES